METLDPQLEQDRLDAIVTAYDNGEIYVLDKRDLFLARLFEHDMRPKVFTKFSGRTSGRVRRTM